MAGEAIRFNASLNTAGFDSGAKNLQNIAAQASTGVARHFGKIAMAVVGIGAAFLGVRAAVQSFNAAIAMGGALNDLSARTGESAGNLAILQRAFQNAGAGAEAVGPTINRLQRAIIEAGEGGAQQAKAFQKLGLDLEDIKRKTPTEQLQAVAVALNGVDNASERGATAMQLLGRSGGELLPLLRAMGVELDTARNQLGSLPGVMDRTNQALDTIGDNFAAIGEKGKEFAAGLLEKMAPALADITTRLANIDAAGFGVKLSEYVAATANWIAETFKLKEALDQIEVAINGITSGNFGDGLSLMFMAARDTALNAINTIVAAGTAALQTIGGALVQLFSPGSTTMAFIEGAFTMLGANIASGIYDSIAGVLEKIPGMGFIASAIREAQAEAEKAVQDISNIMHYEADNLKKEWTDVGRAMPEGFAAAYKANLENPLFEMKDRTAETAAQMEKVAAATRAAAFDAEKFGESLRSAQLDRLSGGGFNPLGGAPETGETGMGVNPQDRNFPWQGAGPSGAPAPEPSTPARSSARAAASAKQQSALERLRQSAQTDPVARAEMFHIQNEQSKAMDRAGALRDGGMFRSSARAEIRGERRAERRADRASARELATDRFGGSNMGEAFRNFRAEMSKQGVFGSSQRDFEKWAKDQAKSEKQREREAKRDESFSGARGGAADQPGGGLATEATLAQILSKIQERPILVA
jgi:hypothetical protein